MIAFFGIWAVAILLVLRWFHALSPHRAWNDELSVEPASSDAAVIQPRLDSSLS